MNTESLPIVDENMQPGGSAAAGVKTPPPSGSQEGLSPRTGGGRRPAKSPRATRTPRSQMRRSQSALQLSSPISRRDEGRRWDDVVSSRAAQGLLSPLKIHVNALRLFEPERLEKLTGSAPTFEVMLPDPFLATPDRRFQRRELDRSARQLTFEHHETSARPATTALPSAAAAAAAAAAATTPRGVRNEEMTALLSPVPPGSPVRKLRRKRASRRLAAKTMPAARARSELEWGPAGQQPGVAPRGGSLDGLASWVLREGDKRHGTALILAANGRPLLASLRAAFVADASPERNARQRGLALIGEWLARLPWFCGGAQHIDSQLMQELAEFVEHTAQLHAQMQSQRHAQAAAYAKAPALLERLRSVQAQALAARTAQQLADGERYYERRQGLRVLRADAEQCALYEGPVPTEPPAQDLRHTDMRRLAQAPTLVDTSMLAPISGADLLSGPRGGPLVTAAGDGATVERHALVCTTRHWNLLSRWAPSLVLWSRPRPGKDPRKTRAKLLRKLIDLASELHALHNWSALFALVVGLGSSALSVLSDSWALVPSRQRATLHELEMLCQPIANFRTYRLALEETLQAGTFCIPYMAIVLKDFEAISEGNPTSINSRGWLNFDKMQMLADAMLSVKRLQSQTCPIKPVDKKHMAMATNLFTRTEQEIWDQSGIVKAEEVELAQAQKKSLRHIKILH